MGSSNTLVFDKCCFCIDLKTGCFIIGYLSLISYIIFGIAILATMAVGGALIASGNGKTDQFHKTLPSGMDNEPIDAEAIGITMLVASVIILIVMVFLVTFVIVLLVGLHKNKPGHVKAYLIYATIFVVISLLHIITIAFSSEQSKNIVAYIISFILNLYFILVIRSQYIVMKENPAARGPAIYTS